MDTQENTNAPVETSSSTFDTVAGSNGSMHSDLVSDMSVKGSVGARFGAFLIDWFLITFATGLVGSLFGFGSVSMVDGSYSSNVSGWATLIIFAYYVIMDVQVGTTLGKMAFKLKVVDVETGKKLGWAQAILREVVGKFVSGAILGIGYLWILWDKDRQGLHDKIGKSYVVKSS